MCGTLRWKCEQRSDALFHRAEEPYIACVNLVAQSTRFRDHKAICERTEIIMLDSQARTPWHSWECDIRTGESVFDKSVRVVSYPVEIADGEVTITI